MIKWLDFSQQTMIWSMLSNYAQDVLKFFVYYISLSNTDSLNFLTFGFDTEM